MRPLLILNERDIRHPNAGGAEVNLFQVGSRLARMGYRPILLCTAFPGSCAEEVIEGIRVLRFGDRFSYYAAIPWRVRRLLSPDTVIVEHLCKLPFCTAWYTQVPVVAVTHHLFGWTAFWQVPAPIALAVVAAEKLIPLAYRKCLFLAVSPSTRADLIARGLPAARVRIVPNGVDCQYYRPRDGPAQAGDPTLLVLGRVEPYKRIDIVLEAFLRIRRRLGSARLRIVGGGTALDGVRARVRQLGLDPWILCTGPVSEEAKLHHIWASHVHLVASEKEGWGLTVMEAAACGVPTVSSDVPGLRDSIRHGETGLLVPHGLPEAMARAAVELLCDDERRFAFGRAARRWAENFSWDRVAEATASLIEAVASGRSEDAPDTPWFAPDEALPPASSSGIAWSGRAGAA